MVITVSCPACSSSFPVDPAKVPEGGVRARCSICAEVFRVDKPASEPAFEGLPEPAFEPLPAPAFDTASAPAFEDPSDAGTDFALPGLPPADAGGTVEVDLVGPAEDWVVESDEVTEPGLPELTEVAAPEATFSPPEVPAPSGAEEPAAGGFKFGKRDPKDKARRLARVLVSDMIMYNAERHQNALASGTLAEDFDEEIDKSWKEFVDQVGEDLAQGDGRQFWTEALNDILAKGQEVF